MFEQLPVLSNLPEIAKVRVAQSEVARLTALRMNFHLNFCEFDDVAIRRIVEFWIIMLRDGLQGKELI